MPCFPLSYRQAFLQWIFFFSFFLNWCSSCIGEGNGNPLQCSCLENPRDGRAWWAALYGVAQSRTRLKWLSSSTVELQFCVSFNLTAKWSSYIYVLYAFFFRLFSIIGYYRESGGPQSCPAICDPMDYTVREILQARILEWIAFPFSRWSSQPRDQTQVSHTVGRFFTSWATWYYKILRIFPWALL